MFFFLLAIALLNAGAGFAAAVCLGRRWRALLAAEQYASLAAMAPALREALLPTLPPERIDLPPPPPAEKSVHAAAAEQFHQQVENFGVRLSEADDRLRQYAETPDPTGIRTCLSDIEATARDYVDHRDAIQQQFANLNRDDSRWEVVRNDVEVTTRLQDAEIKSAQHVIANFDYQADLSEGCREVVGRTHRLMNATDQLRDAIDRAKAEIGVQENHAPTADQRNDPLTGCVNRAGIEADLAAWWDEDPEHRCRLGMAMVDIDRFAEVNQQYGYRVGNEILRAIGRLLEGGWPDGVTIARFAGQQFLLLFTEVELDELTDTVEHIRLTVEKAHFEYKEADIRLAVSCGVTQTLPEDEVAAVLHRAEAALREAKRYGHNRTFVFEGRFPTPVVPPDTGIEEKRIRLQ